MIKLILVKTIMLLLAVCTTFAQGNPERGTHVCNTTARAQTPGNAKDYTGGHSYYVSAWRFLEDYAIPGHFQTGLVSNWMTPQLDRSPPDPYYNTIEGGLGYWHEQRFSQPAPKFIMGGVSNAFYSWANGPGAGKADKDDGYRDWSQPNGMLEIAQLTPHILWAPDGLNLHGQTSGELFGYGYLPLPFTDEFELEARDGSSITVGNQSWTLFMNTKNFKGPAAFFLPTFWNKPVIEKFHGNEGLYLDTRPANPNTSWGIETMDVPLWHAKADDGTIYAKMRQTTYTETSPGISTLLNRPSLYSKAALWDDMLAWFDGGDPVPPGFNQAGVIELSFIPGKENGYVGECMFSRTTAIDVDELEDDLDIGYRQLYSEDDKSWGYKIDTDVAPVVDGKFQLPQYYRLDGEEWSPVKESVVPASTGLLDFEFPVRGKQDPYITPLEKDSRYHNSKLADPWKNPGPVAGPFYSYLHDGTRLTYYWYKFNEQPAIMASSIPKEQRIAMQAKAELIHRHWSKDDEYLAPPTKGELASLDPGALVDPPEEYKIGYVPIVTRQEKAHNLY